MSKERKRMRWTVLHAYQGDVEETTKQATKTDLHVNTDPQGMASQ